MSTGQGLAGGDASGGGAGNRTARYGLIAVSFLYLVMAGIFASTSLDIDEFTFIREPYELLGGDYTAAYLKQHRFGEAASTALKSYYFYWKYRPLFSPLIPARDKRMFERQEREFGYVAPERVSKDDPQALARYNKRLIVPEPDRFYSHGAGKPLLSAIASIPQLTLLKLLLPSGTNLLNYQYSYNYHPIFIVTRLVQLLAGLATVLIVYWILAREYESWRALVGAACVAFFPAAIEYFPNLHQDSLLAPFLVLSAYSFSAKHYKKAGLFFGLALATKNVAIFMLPVFAAQVLATLWVKRSESALGWHSLRPELAGLLKVLVIGLLVLLPFANPISYASEILTPITHREHDQRGENVEQFTLTGRSRTGAQGDSAVTARPSVRFTNLLLHLETTDFFFLAIAVWLFFSLPQGPFLRMCFIFLLMSLPYGLVFGSGLNYRALQFVPFFALLAGSLAPRRLAVGFVALLLFVDVIYCIDPITDNGLHTPVEQARSSPAAAARN